MEDIPNDTEHNFAPFSLVFNNYDELNQICRCSLANTGLHSTTIGRVSTFLLHPRTLFGFDHEVGKGSTFADPELIKMHIFCLPHPYRIGQVIAGAILEVAHQQTQVTPETIAAINTTLENFSVVDD